MIIHLKGWFFHPFFMAMSKLNVAYKYLKHQITGYNRHGIHSPFVYQFLEDVLYDEKRHPEFKVIRKLKKNALNSNTYITITDLGAGSTINTSNKRKIKDIAKNSSKAHKYGELFFRMVQFYQPTSVIELGTSLGFSTLYFALANNKMPVITIEGCEQTKAQAMGNFIAAKAKNIKSLLGNFDQVYPAVLAQQKQADLVFVDGNHSYEATMRYFENTLPYVHSKTILIFDDIHWSEGMQKAWSKIKGHPQVRVTLDLFFVGIVFFNTNLTKQDFKIRY